MDDRPFARRGRLARAAAKHARAVGRRRRADAEGPRLVHDLGRLGISDTIWDTTPARSPRGARTGAAAPVSDRAMLASSEALARLGSGRGPAPRRLDGSGIPAGSSGDTITPAGAHPRGADAYHAMTEARPTAPARRRRPRTRCARRPPGAVRRRRGRSVLGAAGPVKRRRDGPGGLTNREVEVLGCSCAGSRTRRSPSSSSISRKTAGSHIEHIYRRSACPIARRPACSR